MTEKWKLCFDIVGNFTIKGESQSIGKFIRLEEKQCQDIVDKLNEQEERIIDLKNTIIKITIAYQRKHDNTIVNLVDEVWGEDIEDLFIELNQDGGIRND